MKKVSIWCILALVGLFISVCASSAAPDHFYLEMVCPSPESPFCNIQNAVQFPDLNGGYIEFIRCTTKPEGPSCKVELTTAGENGAVSGRMRWISNNGYFILRKGSGSLEGLHALGHIERLSDIIYALEGIYHVRPFEAQLTHLPCDSDVLIWMQPYGNVDHGGGNSFFHDGIDFGNPYGKFYSCADGYVKEVDLDTGKGWPGTNYRITIQVTPNIILDYHFEIGGTASLDERENNILVAAGDQVTAGQHIANLIAIDSDVVHVHFGIYEDGNADKCPLDYFAADVATSLEALYDSGIEKRPSNRPDLCE